MKIFKFFIVYCIELFAHYLNIDIIFYEFTNCGEITHQYHIKLQQL